MTPLTEHDIREILSRKERWVALSTIGRDGFPHTVPIGYFLVGEKLVLGCRDGTQKVKNIERNPKVSVLWENGRGKESITGVLFRGTARIVRSDEERLKFKRVACEQRGVEPPETVSAGSVYIEVTPEKTVSWTRPSSASKRGDASHQKR